MANYARVCDGAVVEIITPPAKKKLTDILHPETAALFTPCGPDVGVGWVEAGAGKFSPVPAMVMTPDLVAAAASRRFAIECGGIEVSGIAVATDRDSQGMIGRAHSLALTEPDEPVDYKASAGWIEIDSATMIAIAVAVGRHVRACFRTERLVCEKIAAGAITTLAEVDAAFQI
jgi:hypothetical protein